MCVILLKEKGHKWMPESIIEAAMRSNPDGFAMAWNEDNKVCNFRTMSFDKTLEKYRELSSRLDAQVTGMIFHARIATHGSKKQKNCHCWVKNGLGFAHNGILRNVPERTDKTDSEVFLDEIFLPVLKGCGIKTAMRVAESVRQQSNSKFAWIDKDGNLTYLGPFTNYFEDGASFMASNNSFRRFSNVSESAFTAKSVFQNRRDYTPPTWIKPYSKALFEDDGEATCNDIDEIL